MSNVNQFEKAPDIKILNTIRQADHYPSHMVEEAKTVALTRGIVSKEELKKMHRLPALRRKALHEIQSGLPIQTILDGLMSEGLSAYQAQEIINDAYARHSYAGSIHASSKGSSTSPIWIIMVMLFIVFRMVTCAVRMG